VLTHGDHPDFTIISGSLTEKRAVELTSLYLDDNSVIRDHVRRSKGPIPIPYDAQKLDIYKERILRAVERKCRSFASDFGAQLAILAVYLNEYMAIQLTREDLLDLLYVRLPRVAGDGPFDQIVLWGGCPDAPVIFHRHR
jgi:hypothetical protein